uniref:Polyadenylate-binding protein 1-like n=2 Tax=Culex pipiens TaxID=7175 RepID=A0A8D8GT81_CULPI
MSFFYDDNDDEDILFGWEFDTYEGCYVRSGRFCAPFPRPRLSRFQQVDVRPLYVRNLPGNVDEYGLEGMFSPFGNIVRTRVVQDRYGNSKEFGFVWFSSDDEADEALYWMNGRWIEDCELYVAPAEYREDRQARWEAELEQDVEDDDILYGWDYDVHEKMYVRIFSPRDCAPFPSPLSPTGPAQLNVRPLYVGNLSWKIDDYDLYNLFSPFGHVTSTELATDKRGASRRFGFVTFATDEETDYAMYWMNGRCIEDYCLDVELANNW